MELSALPALELLNASSNEIADVDCVLPAVRRLLLDDNRLTAIPPGVLRCRQLQVNPTSVTSSVILYETFTTRSQSEADLTRVVEFFLNILYWNRVSTQRN